jgi:DNA-binding NtrC family response regulator
MTASPSTPNQLLIIDDDSITTELLRHFALQNDFKPVVCSTFQEAAALDWVKFSAILIDLELPDGDGFELLCRARKQHPQVACFIITSRDRAESAVSALKAGAEDYFTKPFDHDRIFASIRAALPRLEKARRAGSLPPCEWRSPGMVAVEEGLRTAARTDFPVLLVGEPGTGRRAFAQQIHSRSHRAKLPFAAVYAADLDETALELELFGGESRQSPGTYVRRRGKIESVHGGTLFIQDIDQASINLQGRLIDVLERVSGTADARSSDFRLIASSSSKLDDALTRKQFRNDLYYRLGTHAIHLPKLCDVAEDIPIWCDRILTEICLKQRVRRPRFTKGALEALVDYPWPGNLDQLRQNLEQVVVGCGTGLIGKEDLPDEIQAGAVSPDGAAVDLAGVARIDDLEKISLVSALDACNGNRRRAAKRLGVSLRTIYNMIDRHSLRDQPLKDTPT